MATMTRDMEGSTRGISILRLLIVAMLVISCVWCSVGASSSVPEMEDQFVYGLTTWDGLAFSSGFVPKQIDEIHIIASTDNVFAPFDTKVYFWPITGEYVADWTTKQVPVDGTLEVLRDGSVIETISLQKYTLRYPEGFDSSNVEILTGDRAIAAYEEYRAAVNEFNESVASYEQARANYNATIAEMFRLMREEGRTFAREEIPEPPPEPEPPSYYVQSVRTAFIVNLPRGQYVIRMRQNGEIVPGSVKTLSVFEPRRSGLSFVIRPEGSWTVPLRSDAEGYAVYLSEAKPLYIQLFDVKEYNSYHYTRMTNPANPTAGLGTQNEFVWVVSGPQRSDVRVRVYDGDVIVSEIDQRPYYVAQTQGSALGYEIMEWNPAATEMIGTQPTFSAFRLHVPPGHYRLQAVTSGGEFIPGGERVLRDARSIGHLWWTTLIPILVGIGVYAARMYGSGALRSLQARLPEERETT